MRKLILVLIAVFVINIPIFGCADGRAVIVIENSSTDADAMDQSSFSETVEQTDAPPTVDSVVHIESQPESEPQLHDTDAGEIYSYVLNKNTKKFHFSYCASVDEMKEKNREFYSGTRDELLNSGFSPCGRCKP